MSLALAQTTDCPIGKEGYQARQLKSYIHPHRGLSSMTKTYLYIFVSLWGGSVFAQSYNVTNFYDPNALSVQISGVNAGGIVVGYEVRIGELNGTSEGFKYDHGTVTVIHCPRALSPSASGSTGVSGIDSEGNILGQYTSFPKTLPGGLSGNFLLDYVWDIQLLRSNRKSSTDEARQRLQQ